ncbi:unnamed protein product, partial [Gadus morhua 'NCC']
IRGTEQQNDTQQRARLQETTEVKAAPAPPCHWLYSLPNGTAVTPALQPGQMPTICGGFQRQTAFTGRSPRGILASSPKHHYLINCQEPGTRPNHRTPVRDGGRGQEAGPQW